MNIGGYLMSVSFKDIEQQARSLSAEERAALAETLLESLHEPLSDIESAWALEIENRVAAYDRGETKTFSAEDVFAEARRLSR
jgi:putative addiction module component (TIGR02574 family)